MEHEIRREAVAVAPYLFVEAFRGDAVESGEIGVDDDSMAA